MGCRFVSIGTEVTWRTDLTRPICRFVNDRGTVQETTSTQNEIDRVK